MSDNDSMPEDPVGSLAEAAISLHVYKTQLVSAGFTNEEAMQIVVSSISGVVCGAAE